MGLENRPDEGSVVMRFWGAVSGAVEAVSGSFLGTSEAVLGHAEAVCALPLHENMHAPVCTLLLSFRLPPSRWAQVASFIGNSHPNLAFSDNFISRCLACGWPRLFQVL